MNHSIPSPTIYTGSKEQLGLTIGNMTPEPNVLTSMLDLFFGPCKKSAYVDSIILLNQSLFFFSVFCYTPTIDLCEVNMSGHGAGGPVLTARSPLAFLPVLEH